MRQRAQTLTGEQIELLANGSLDSRTAIAWLSVLKQNAFVFAFASEVLRSKTRAHDHVLRPSDYEEFLESEAPTHPELAALTDSTKGKIRQVLLRMLREVGIVEEGTTELVMQQPVLPPDVMAAIVADDPRWLAGFLVRLTTKSRPSGLAR